MRAQPTIVYLPSVDSTNRVLREKLRAGELSRGVVWAGEQSAGRGRLSRSWQSPPGGLYYSAATPTGACPPPLFGFAAGLAAHTTLAALAPEIKLKWPNDLLYCPANGPECKLGGMLSEYLVDGLQEPHVIVGLGVNINAALTLDEVQEEGPKQTLPPTSLREITGAAQDLQALVKTITTHIFASFDALRGTATHQEAVSSLRTHWANASATLGRRVRIDTPARSFEGWAEALDPGFGLCLRDEQDTRHVIQAGDCIHLR